MTALALPKQKEHAPAYIRHRSTPFDKAPSKDLHHSWDNECAAPCTTANAKLLEQQPSGFMYALYAGTIPGGPRLARTPQGAAAPASQPHSQARSQGRYPPSAGRAHPTPRAISLQVVSQTDQHVCTGIWCIGVVLALDALVSLMPLCFKHADMAFQALRVREL